MEGSMSNPTAFISYSWEGDTHKQWVRDFATKLRRDGVESILDQWHAVPGDQLPVFMEQAVRDNDFVLVVCTPRYKKRSDNRSGGVGYEGDVMTAEVFNSGEQRKFIPILRQGKWPEEAAPTWMAGKYYIDLSGDPYSDDQYHDLLDTLLGRREPPPAVGCAQKKAVTLEAESSDELQVVAFKHASVSNVLIESTRRCCLCFFFDGDLTQKDGMIAHIDGDTSNGEEGNLAYLCATHHKAHVQGVGVTPEEILYAKGRLVQLAPSFFGSGVATVTIELNRPFETFTDEEQKNVLAQIKPLLSMGSELRVRHRRPGSVKLTIDIALNDVKRLADAIAADELAKCGAVGITIDDIRTPKRRVAVDSRWENGISVHTFSGQQLHEIVRNPDREQLLFPQQPMSRSDPGVALLLKSYGTPGSKRSYTALVVAASTPDAIDVQSAFRIYGSDVPHSLDASPLDVLKAFLGVYGFAETYRDLGKRLLVIGERVDVPLHITTREQLGYYVARVVAGRNAAKEPTEFQTISHMTIIGGKVFIGIAFSIRTNLYARSLIRHRVKIPRRFLSDHPYSA